MKALPDYNIQSICKSNRNTAHVTRVKVANLYFCISGISNTRFCYFTVCEIYVEL